MVAHFNQAFTLMSAHDSLLKSLADEEKVGFKKMLSLLVSAKQQCIIWDNTNHAEISAEYSIVMCDGPSLRTGGVWGSVERSYSHVCCH